MKENSQKEIFSWIKYISFALILVLICRHYIFIPVTVQGTSMNPTFNNNDKVMVVKMSAIEHFDMIVFHAPTSDDKHIKRVIGLAGDTVKVENDQLYINNQLIQEPYLIANKAAVLHEITENFEVIVPLDSLFVMGDNRLGSEDSRTYGFVPEDAVVGEVKLRFFPLNDIGIPK
ncbi:signal peptidase I [Sutcliffiella halmapala]|uniref:signal peptidase I n=1 Tax=Sutcliffiella halmapala TaxID=79882 RepID=UPI000995BE54|nr:signal peptidase I [Sutcliffiella halmapala]